MNRCATADRTRFSGFYQTLDFGKYALFFIASCVGIACAGATFSLKLQAQTIQREFPAAALRGTLVVTAPPVVSLDGQTDKLSPSARIRAENNMIALSGSLVGQQLVVNYTRDAAGLVNEVWVLTAQEARLKRATKARSSNFFFESDPQPTTSQIGSSQPGSSQPGSSLPDTNLPQPAVQTR